MGSVESYESKAGRRYRVRYRRPDNKQTDKRGFRTKREAEAFLATVEASKLRGEWVDPARSRVRFGDVAEAWYDGKISVKATTRSGYRNSLDKHVLPKWGSTRVADIDHAAVQAWVATLSKSLSPSSTRQIYLVLSGVLAYAVRDGRLGRNVAAEIALPRVVASDRHYLNHSQVHLLAEEVGEWATLIRFLAYTGLRWGEATALRPEDVDLDARFVRVRRAVADVRGNLVWGTPKTHEQRTVPYPSLLDESIAEHVAAGRDTGLLFCGPTGAPLRGGNFRRRVFSPAVERLSSRLDEDFPQVTPHDLRHTAASLAMSAGANVKLLQRMLGHASAAMTLDVYADLFPEDLTSVSAALDRAARDSFVGKSWADAADASVEDSADDSSDGSEDAR
ncbi:tyrosine-type recombinase/integrase [Microbacterium thalassium]|uniref:Integrase n=1 Tax=Microbacterium thalassium TaxID=362649 RepID=A0A7X0FLX9_9MICO|nr:tyrosine-type recombinase/integrase [Microbacterium thalassium]MBB6389918.1 integrase [Microbacterium thalassium]GLK24605.1 site-specific integrase [Microbacterium thalassium]